MNTKIFGHILLIIMLLPMSLGASEKDLDKEKRAAFKPSILEISDRAKGVHDASNIGLYFTNYGRISRGTFASRYAGEYPINSDHNYIWKLMPLVGVAPDRAAGRAANVIQSVYISNIEWEAVPDFHNPARASIAFSDDPITWPASVWFFHDDQDNSLFVSNQDSYCAYNDANNTVEVLGIQTIKTGYAFANPDIKDMVFFKFEITNQSLVSYDSVYFGFHHDFDIGGDSEYRDDLLGWDSANNFIYTYDADNYSAEWAAQPGVMGITMLETPLIDGSMAGITDMHYGRLDLVDSTLMATLSSNLDLLPVGVSPVNFFNTGSSPDIHFDDPGLIPPSGADIYGTISSGPYDLSPTDTLTFIICIIAGDDIDDLYTNLTAAQALYAKNFVTARPPQTPVLNGIAGDGFTTLYWSDEVESVPDEASEMIDFEGYHLYRSVNAGASWDQVDRNQVSADGLDPIPLASFDRINGIGDDLGMAYSYLDETVINGFEYWYSLTAFDHGDSVTTSLESPIGNSLSPNNVVGLTPRSNAPNHISSASSGVTHTGTGRSNYLLKVDPVSPGLLSAYKYILTFDYAHRQEIGDPGILSYIEIVDSSIVPTKHYGFEFVSSSAADLYTLTPYELIYTSMPFYWDNIWSYIWADSAFYLSFENTDISKSPSPGDYFSLIFAATLRRIEGSDTSIVMQSQQFDLETPLVSEDGLIMLFEPQPILQDVSSPPLLNFTLEFEVLDEASLVASSYQISVSGVGSGPGSETFIVMQVARDMDAVLFEADTLYTTESFNFDGIEASLTFDPGNPPPVGTMATLTSVPPYSPHIQDVYTFGVTEEQVKPLDAANELESIRVVPNPYLAGSLWESEYGSYRREPIRQIQFINLPMECEINIFTLSGDLIKTLEHNENHGTETWDMRAEGGREIVSGIYLYQVKSAGLEYLNRFAVIK